MKTFKLLVLATALALSPACKKKEAAKQDPTPAQGSAATPTPTPDPGSAATPTPDPAAAKPAEENADWIKVHATHFTKNENDPVEVKFETFKVTKATFDPQKIEGGTATIEIDLASLKSGDDKRDGHLKTADYIDVSKFATAVVEIDNVKKKDDQTYTADANVKFHGVDKKYPVTFEVVEAKDDWIRVKGEHKFPRLDFKVGKEKTGPDESVAQDLTVKMQLTLKKT
jgi:polyisoprenoid-binding protein YceI